VLLALVSATIVLAFVRREGSHPARRVGSAGVTVAIPNGWHSLPEPGPPPGVGISDPVPRLVVASAPIGFAADGCNGLGYAFSRTAVALVVMEWVRPTPGSLPPRPRRFTQGTLPVRPPPALECWNGPGGGTEFTDHRRRLDAFVLVGRAAPAELVRRARQVLDTLTVTSRAG